MNFKNKIKKSKKKNKKIYRKKFNTKKRIGGLAPPSDDSSKPEPATTDPATTDSTTTDSPSTDSTSTNPPSTDPKSSTPDIARPLNDIRDEKNSAADLATGVAEGTTAANHARSANDKSQELGVKPGFIKQGIAKLLIKAVPQLNYLGLDKVASLVSDRAIGNVEQTATKLVMTAVTAIPIPDIGEIADIPADLRQFWIDGGVFAEEVGEMKEALNIVQKVSGDPSKLLNNKMPGIPGKSAFSFSSLKKKNS